jgi:hypothetical protein
MTKLETLDSSLFVSLNADEALMVLGGLANSAGFTYLGRTERSDGKIDNDYTED